VNGLAERHQLTMQDVALQSLADSADERHGFKPLSDRFAGYALVYANDLHNAIPASGARVDRTPFEGLLGRQVKLGAFCHFGCWCWVHTPGKPFVHTRKFDLRARPGRFIGFDQPFGSGIYKVLLDSGEVTQSQTVIFDDAPHVPPLMLLPDVAAQQHLRWAGEQGEGDMNGDSDSADKEQVHTMVPPVPLVLPVAPFAGASDDGSNSADEVELHSYPAVPASPPVAPAVPSAALPAELTGSGAQAVGQPVQASRNPHPRYASAATRQPAQGVGGIRGEPMSRLTVPEQRPVHMAPSR
jgi:hypothetical protein